MIRSGRWSLALAVAAGLGMAGLAEAKTVLVLPRPGEVGVGVQGQFGTLVGSGDLADDFGAGGGLTVRLRYRMRYERAVGLSFETQGFEVKSDPALGAAASADTALHSLSLVTSGVELYQLFDTRSPTMKMLSIGAGLAQVRRKLNDGETDFQLADGLYLSFGAGIEKFFYRSLAFDLSTRYMAVFQGGSTNHDLQASLGLIFYASY